MIKKFEQYYTNPDIALQLINYVSTLYPFDKFDTIIEPCSGNGKAFADYFYYNKQYRNKLLAIDIEPKEQGYIYQYDALKYDFEHIYDNRKLIITNPPFSKSFEFLRKFNSFTKSEDVIAVILPISYTNHFKFRSIPHKFHLINQIIMPENSFCNDKKTYDYKTVFMIFEKKEEARADEFVKPISKFFTFTRDKSLADIAIKRVGYKASNLITDKQEIDNSNEESCYYIKLFDNIDKGEFIEEYNKIDFTNDINGVKMKCLAKYRLINRTNEDMYIKF